MKIVKGTNTRCFEFYVDIKDLTEKIKELKESAIFRQANPENNFIMMEIPEKVFDEIFGEELIE